LILDGTDLPILKPSVPFELRHLPKESWDWLRSWHSHKFNKYAIKYELGVHVKTGRIVWFHGAFRGGMHDLNIFRSKLLPLLEPGEMILADRGYVGSMSIITPTKGSPFRAFVRSPEDSILNKVRAKVEIVIGRMKYFNILTDKFRGDLKTHRGIFDVICRLTNLMMMYEPLKSKKEEKQGGYVYFPPKSQ
jgi:hypothetical protein